eukprot:CAMPEP_0115012916 /NCGR_PEP_ID=MMETSP0216-20121206/25050_1 /TAXON_ID=223996 /ORGANISM="Protocruzia adherens, Strain Boccale" /LENGTH=426 /DNA_ID=CAMNT_0002382121 /DNA_START=136 /DNA_END=1416 /DNA_ORIENTATION=+
MRIDADLLRKRAEHNEGMISTLEEVSLHQFEIEKIENLDKLCRHLKILYLQNNIIDKLENMKRLKELEYVNLALNNISVIENLEGCESLYKLDLTVNFVDVEDLKVSAENLAKCPAIKDLYLTGNPCAKWDHCRDYIAAKVPQLEQFDGKEITHTERIQATQILPQMEAELAKLATESLAKKEATKDKEVTDGAFTKESRVKMYKEIADEREEKERNQNKTSVFDEMNQKPTRNTSVYKEDGTIRMCNEGKYKFFLDEEHPEYTIYEMMTPKFMDTSSIDVDINPKYVRISVKDKITQIRLNEEVIAEKSEIKRATTSGLLWMKMPKVEVVDKPWYWANRKKEQEQEESKKPKTLNKNQSSSLTQAVDIHNIVDEKKNLKTKKITVKDEEGQIKEEITDSMPKQEKTLEELKEIVDHDLDDLPDLD